MATEFRHMCCDWATRTEKYIMYPAGHVAAGLLTPTHICPVPDSAQAVPDRTCRPGVLPRTRRRPLRVGRCAGFTSGALPPMSGCPQHGLCAVPRKRRSPRFARLSIRTRDFTVEFGAQCWVGNFRPLGEGRRGPLCAAGHALWQPRNSACHTCLSTRLHDLLVSSTEDE
jgi:hypothetical protein